MSKFRTPDDIVVSVADENDSILEGLYYKRLSGKQARHTEPTPSGQIRAQRGTGETNTGQIRRQQAADPFSS